MDASDSSDAWNSTTLNPNSIAEEDAANAAMAAGTLKQTTEIDNALAQYNQIRSRYNDILEEAITAKNPAKRTQLVSTITAMNQQLSTIVASIQQMYDSNQSSLKGIPPINFAADLEKYKQDLRQLMMEKDELAKLKIIHATMTPTAQPYYLYIVGILLMLVILLVMFTFTSLMTGASNVVSSIPLPTMPTLPTLPSLSEVTSGPPSVM
jgi:hypothetical protein